MRTTLAAAALAALCLAVPVAAQMSHGTSHATMQPEGASAQLGPVSITGAWARAAAVPGGASAAYLTLTITGGSDRLIAAESDAAARVELHTHEVDANGVARMRQVEAIPVAAGAPAELKPGGLHVMLMGIGRPLAEGETIDLTLVFEKAGRVSLTVPVKPAMAMKH